MRSCVANDVVGYSGRTMGPRSTLSAVGLGGFGVTLVLRGTYGMSRMGHLLHLGCVS